MMLLLIHFVLGLDVLLVSQYTPVVADVVD